MKKRDSENYNNLEERSMTKAEIITKLEMNYKAFADFIDSLSEDKFMFAPDGKWTAGQQLDHLIKSVAPLSSGLRLPKFAVRISFGKSNRPSKSYDELVRKYQSRLEAGGKAPGRFIPKQVLSVERGMYLQKLLKKIKQLCNNINSYSENELDTFILPHPLLGKVTLREMMYFTIYHAEHHQKLVIKYI